MELNEAVRKGGLSEIDSARLKQAEVSQIADELSSERSTLCNDLALALQLPVAEITLSRLAGILASPWSEKLLAFRDRLQPIVAEVHFLNNRNASLINYCRSYVQRILAGATGSALAVTRYGRTGTQLGSNYGTLFVVTG